MPLPPRSQRILPILTLGRRISTVPLVWRRSLSGTLPLLILWVALTGLRPVLTGFRAGVIRAAGFKRLALLLLTRLHTRLMGRLVFIHRYVLRKVVLL